jgi:Kef-type K+ transport system membrane component KefB
VIGLETDLARLIKCGIPAVVVAVLGVALTFAGGFALGRLLGLPQLVSLFLGASLTATSVGISARVLSDLGHIHDAESQVVIGAAVVDDVLGVILLTLLGRVAEGGDVTPFAIARATLVAFGFVVLAIVVGSRLAPKLVQLIDRLQIARGIYFASLLFALTLAYIAERSGSAIIIGSFAAGLVLARTEKGEQIQRDVHDVTHFFVPIFFVAVGAAIDIHALNLGLGVGMAAIAVAGKMLAGALAPGKGLRRAVIGAGMIPRGEVSLIFAQMGLAGGLISPGLYGAITVMVIITAFATPLLLRMLLERRPAEVIREEAADLVMDAPMDDERRREERRRE